MIIAATGHRPEKLGGYSQDVADNLKFLAYDYLRLHMNGQSLVAISGMALGWDTAYARAALELEIPLIAAIPFKGQHLKWPEESQKIYVDLMGKAAEIKVVCEGGYAPWKMHKRNYWMVDQCDRLVALWDGSLEGGTASCVAYADGKKPIDHLWERWSIRG